MKFALLFIAPPLLLFIGALVSLTYYPFACWFTYIIMNSSIIGWCAAALLVGSIAAIFIKIEYALLLFSYAAEILVYRSIMFAMIFAGRGVEPCFVQGILPASLQ